MIHPLSEVLTANIGENTDIWQFVVVLQNASIGNNCNINCHCFIENEVVIGDDVTIKCGVYLWDGITIEDSVQIGPNVTFINDKYPRAKKGFVLQRTTIKNNASIGGAAVILCGLTVGEYAMIGAGSVVTKNIPANTLWYGNPANQKGFVTKDGIVLDMNKKDKNGVYHKI